MSGLVDTGPLWCQLEATPVLLVEWVAAVDGDRLDAVPGLEDELARRGYRTRSRLNGDPLRRPVHGR